MTMGTLCAGSLSGMISELIVRRWKILQFSKMYAVGLMDFN